MANKGRNKHMALLTLIATTLVVAGHCDITPDYKQTWIFKWVYSFHMPLFFMISGYIFCLSNPVERLKRTTFTQFIHKKFERLLIPFIFIDTIIFLIKATLLADSDMVAHPTVLTLECYIEKVAFRPIGFMWFLPTLFWMFVIAFPLWKYIKLHKPLGNNMLMGGGSLILLIVSATAFMYKDQILIFQFVKSLYFLIFFWIGVLYCEYSETINCMVIRYRLPIIIVFGAISILLLGSVHLKIAAGIILCTTLALLLADKVPDTWYSLTIFTFPIYLLSYFPQMFVRGPLAHHFPEVNQYFFSAISFLSGILIPIFLILIYQRLTSSFPKLKFFDKPIGL